MENSHNLKLSNWHPQKRIPLSNRLKNKFHPENIKENGEVLLIGDSMLGRFLSTPSTKLLPDTFHNVAIGGSRTQDLQIF